MRIWTDEQRKTQSEKIKGSNHPMWKGGKVDVVCVVCGAVIQVNIEQAKTRKYCSRECRWKAESGENHFRYKTKIEITCEICGKVKLVEPWDSQRKYCSRKCADVGYSRNYSKENHPQWEGGQVELSCTVCGKLYKVDKFLKDTSKACSVKCGRVAQGRSIAGENHPFWRGGCNSWGYTKEFSYEFKSYIRERDGFTCAVCGKWENGDTFDVHHIDYNKKHSYPENCITLCDSCHTKTTMGDRDYWEHRLYAVAIEREAISKQVI
jgi:5-methylcytosine-specific restriction endonuclease McrA